MPDDLREIALEVNVPVLVKPWRARAVKTKYGDKLMLVVKEGNEEAEVKWLPLDLANDMVALGVMEIGKWDDGNPKYSVKKGAPEIAICKRQPAGQKFPHFEVALPGEQDGPDMPAPKSSAPAAPREPAAQAAAPSRGTPPSMDDAVVEAIKQTKRLAVGLGIENTDDPLVAAAMLEAAKSLVATLYIQSHR